MNTTRRGSRYRKQVQDWLTGIGYATSFRPWMEKGDDIVAEGPDHTLSVECKDHRHLALSEFVDQAERNATGVAVVFAKRRGRSSVDDHYVVMTGRSFAALVSRGGLG